ncbi:YfaZ family outer membrane protein [Enterobacter cloacae]|uniref:YfaZ family outer membrane protein n=1 Tax=Enterobacter cloacae TaxID=550 RepID=UPI001C4BCF33|nr:YfaZ family outer membrane protein [Enterobacter cloacae]
MFKKTLTVVAILSTFSVGANAAEIGAQLGTQHTELNALIAPEPTGIFYTANWANNYNDGRNSGGVGLGYQVSLGKADLYAGAKAIYMAPKKGDNGFAAPIGGGVRVHFSDEVYAYGEGYTAPRGLNNAVENYVEVDAGLAWQARDEVKLKAGYRHISVHGKSGTPNHTLLDGAYLGAALQF